MNNPNFFLTRAIRVRNVIDHTTKALTTEQYLSAMGDDSMMFEAVTLEELEATHLYDLESDHQMMMEAITTTKNRIERTMAAFTRELNKMLNGTGMEALVAEIGQPRKAGQVAVMMARIPLSDEQSISVVFHSPTNDPGKITETDELVAFRFLLNKRDITHVVAPSGGRDISLKQTCLTLANLAERNSAKFQSKQAETKAKEAELITVQSATEALEAETADAVEKADTMAASLEAAKKAEEKAAAQLSKQVSRNDELRKKLAALGGTAIPGNTSDEQQEPKIKLRLHWDNKSAAAMDRRATKTLTGTGWKLVDESPYIFLTSSSHTASGFSSAAEAEQWAKSHPQSGAARSANRRKGEAIMANLQSLAGSNKGYDQAVFLSTPDSKEKTKADKDAMAALLMDVVYSVTTSGWDTGIYLRSDFYLPYMVAHYFGLSVSEASSVVNWMPIRTKESGPVKFDGAKLLDGSYPKDKLIAALAALGGHYAEPGTPPAVTEPLSLTDELTALEQKADLTLPEVEAFEARVDALFNSAQLPLTEWSAINTRVKKLRAGLQPPIDTIRTVKHELSIYGRFALSNGAVIAKVMRDEAGELEGYVTITEKDGTGYVLKAKSSQGASMEDAAKALYRAYREGKAEKYKGSLPAIEPAPAPEPSPSPSPAPEPVVDDKTEPAPEPAPELEWNEQTRATKFAELRTLIQAKFETDMDSVEIWQAVMTPNSPSVAENPFFVDGTHQGAELTKAFQEAGYSGTVRSMFNTLADQVWAAIEQANKTPEEIEAERKEKALKASIANLTELTKGARLPQGWRLSVDPEFGELGAVSIGTPLLPNDDEHDGFWLVPEVNEAGELSGTYQLATGNGDPITTGITGWKEAKQQMIDSYQKDVDSNQPAPEPAPTGENQWGETDPEVVALLEQLEALRTTETNAGAYLAKLQEVAAKLEESGAIARHEPYLHTVSDRLTELMEAEGV